MELNELVQVFGNGFFPCIMCAALFWYSIKQNEQHKAEMDTMKDSLNNNTLAIQHLTDLITKEAKK